MDWRPLVEGPIANIGISIAVLIFCVCYDFFCKKNDFFGIPGLTTVHCEGVTKGRVCCCSFNDM